MIMRERGRPLQDGKRGAEIAELAEASPAKRARDGSALGEFSAEKGPKALFDDDALCAVRAEISPRYAPRYVEIRARDGRKL